MAVWDLFSKRKKQRERHGQPDVYRYDDLPQAFRIQVIHIWIDAIGPWASSHSMLISPLDHPPNRVWHEIHHAIAREKGVFDLATPGDDPFRQCQHYLQTASTEEALDLIELSFRVIDRLVRGRQSDGYRRSVYGDTPPDEAIAELNARFREHGIGYQYDQGRIERVDSQYIHAEAVKPALQLLSGGGKGFSGPLQEFLRAHEHYRKGEHKEAMVDALKAFESTMKAICTARRWAFDPNKDTAKQLIDIVFANNLVPPYLQAQFTALRSVLESGVPTVRNKTAGHGQGATPTTVPGYLAGFVLHTTASNIVLLVEAHKTMPR